MQKRFNDMDSLREKSQALQIAHTKARKKMTTGSSTVSKERKQPNTQQVSHQRNRGFIQRNGVFIAGIVVVTVVIMALFILVSAIQRGCSSDKSIVSGEAVQTSAFDWMKLERDGDRLKYVVDGKVESRIGVDVSENQHDIDWNAVAADGIDFAMIRVGYRGATKGDLYLDEYFWSNFEGARAAGLDCGVYFFSQARTTDEAIEEANFILSTLSGAPLECPIVFDSEVVVLENEESRTSDLTQSQMTENMQAFCRRIEEAGYTTMVYGNASDISRFNYDEISSCSVWWAQYDVLAPSCNLNLAMWQYTNAGEVAGIPTYVDLNIDLTHVSG